MNLGGIQLGVSWRPGALVGEYRLVSRLAVGGTAEVWLATMKGAAGADQSIALKTMRPGMVRSPEQIRCFASEAEISGKLSHPNIVRMLAAGRAGGRYCMAMEYVSGLTLRGLSRALRLLRKRFPLWLLSKLTLQVCGALHYAHEFSDGKSWLGFVHRDVSPDNLMIVPAGTVKMIDFGSARLASNPRITGPFMGKLRYAAPERVQGLPEDRRCDVYSLGVVLYEHVAGAPPFDGDDMTIISRIVEGRPTLPREIVPDLPPAFEQIILRAMARDPADRYPTAEALGNDVRKFLEQLAPDPAEGASVEAFLQPVFRLPGAGVPAAEGQKPADESAGAAPELERFAPDAHESHDEVTRRSLLAPYIESEPMVLKRHGATSAPPEELTPVVTVIGPNDLPAPPPGPPVVAAPPAPPSPSVAAVPWLFERRQAGFTAPSGLFGRPGRDEDRSDDVFAGRAGTTSAPAAADAFAIRRGRAGEPASPWRSGSGAPPTPAPPATPGPQRERRRPPNEEAARCFDRGLLYVADKKYDLALEQWERARELDPDNRLYRSNLRRLRAQVAGRDRPPNNNGD